MSFWLVNIVKYEEGREGWVLMRRGRKEGFVAICINVSAEGVS